MRFNLKKHALLVLGALIAYYLFSYLMDPFGDVWQQYLAQPMSAVLSDFVPSAILCVFFCEASLLIDKILNRRLVWTKHPRKRLIVQVAAQLFCSALLTIIIGIILYVLPGEGFVNMNKSEITSFIQWILTTGTISLLISALNTGHYMINNWKASAAEAAEHKLRAVEMQRLATEAELRALKLQLDPHFVFNNLSVLSELILEDQQLGYEYAENFARVYRYLLLNARRDLISLEEEMKFLRAYLFLIENRVGSGVHFLIDIGKEALSKSVPPLVLQLLIENVLKHNSTDKKNPLLVHVSTSKDLNLVVTNNRRPLVAIAPSSKLGLINVKSRYVFLQIDLSKLFPMMTFLPSVFP